MDLDSLLVLVEAYGLVPKGIAGPDTVMSYAVMKYLIEQGVLDKDDHYCSTWVSASLHYAIERDLLSEVMSMIALLISSCAVDEALRMAARLDRLEILEELIDKYPDERGGQLGHNRLPLVPGTRRG